MQLKEYKRKINNERLFYKKQIKSAFVDKIFKRPSYLISKYLYHLRMMEYYQGGVLYYFHYYFYRRLSYTLGFQIPANTTGFGLKIYHWGHIIINGNAKIGNNCTIYPGVTVGKTEGGVPVIGDNCFLGLGSKVLGPVKLGNNVKVLPNAVVTKSFPDNVILGGIPAKIIKAKNNEKDSDM